MKVVARKGEGTHEVVVELWMSRAQATDYVASGGLGIDFYEMADECVVEHLKGLHRASRTRMTPKAVA